MKFFKRLWLAKCENQKNDKTNDNIIDCKFKILSNGRKTTTSTAKYQKLQERADKLQKRLEQNLNNNKSENREIVTPDEFFTAPDAVELYKEEKMLATWIFVDLDSIDDDNHEKSKNIQGGKSLAIIKGKPIFTTYDKESFRNSLMGPLLEPIFVSSNTVPQLFQSRKGLSIQETFGLSDDGQLLVNLDHILIYKGSESLHYKFSIFSSYENGVEITDESKTERHYSLLKRIIEWIKSLLVHPQNRSSNISPGESVEAYALELAKNSSSTFAKNVENFICCTKESHETAPQVVMRNMRQFMSGMKNYLVKHGEGNFQIEVQQACARLKPNEFLNLDTILENVMHILVVLPLKEHLYKLFVDFYTNSGDLKLLIDNIKIASERSPSDLGIEESKITLPDGPELLHLSILINRMEELELPLEKLNVLFTVVSTIFKCSKSSTMNADDFLPILIYVIAKTGFISSEIEAEFIWGLINPSLLSGEAGYYLTAVCSAVHMLKNFSTELNQKANSGLVQTTNAYSILKVIIPDECNGSLQNRTLPVRPNTTVREVSRIIAHKARINSQDYGLFKLINGDETLLQDNECPQEVSALTQKKCVFIYRRLDAKIAWPTLT